jgi:Uncharacterised nucleotidyltransferase
MSGSTANSQVDVLCHCLTGRADQIFSELSEKDQNGLITSAVAHGTAPWLYQNLRSSSLISTFPAFLNKLHEVYLLNHLRSLTVWQQLHEVLGILERAEIPVILLKGAHLAEVVYGEIALRPMRDLDLLVRKEDLLRTWQLLLDSGYSPLSISDEPDYTQHHHLRPFCKAGAIPIEIHHTLEVPGASFAIDVDHFWSRAQKAVIAGVKAQVLCPEDLLLHLCLHSAYNHRFQIRLLQLCDIAVSIRHYDRQIDWQRLATISNEYGVSRFIFCCLLLVAETLGVEIPSSLFEALHHESSDREIVRTIQEFLFSAPDDLPFMQQRLRERESFLEKIRILARSLFPVPRELRQMYQPPTASGSIYLYYLVRPLDLLIRRGPFLMGLVVRSKSLRPALEREEKRRLIQRWVEDCVRDKKALS